MKYGTVTIPGFRYSGQKVGLIGPYEGKSDNFKGHQVYDIILKPDSQQSYRMNMEFSVDEIELIDKE